VMTYWGLQSDEQSSSLQALRTHVAGQHLLTIANTAFQRYHGRRVLQFRFGVATGRCVAGPLGARGFKLDYTIIGDTVNLASRLEGLNKLYGTAVLVSEATYAGARDRVIGRPVDIVQVKGRSSGVKVYELLALVDENDDEARKAAAAAEDAFESYVARDFRRAAACFESMLQHVPGDRVAALLLDRCREFIALPPPADWAGVYVATQK
jgi:adenylate cyclase